MLRVQRINDIKIKPIALPNVPKELIRGNEMFDNIYSNIFLLAKKKSGKTSVIWNILKKCMGRDTRLVIFSATVHKDPTMRHIVKHFEDKGNTVITFTSLKDGKTDNLNELVEMLRDPEEEEEEKEKSEDEYPFIICGESKKEDKPRKKRKEKLLAPELIFVLDDLSTQLQSPSVDTLLKSNRHYKCKVILSSQYLHDLKIASIMQLDYLLVFGGQTVDKLQLVHQRTDLSLPFQHFLEFYYYATAVKHHFLFIDTVKEEFRKDFNQKLEI